MSQRFHLEPDWQGWNDRIAVPVIPASMQGSFNYKLYKEKSAQLEQVDKQIEGLLSLRSSIVVSIITMRDNSGVRVIDHKSITKKGSSKKQVWPIGNLSSEVDTDQVVKTRLFPVYKRVADYDLRYTREEISLLAYMIKYDTDVNLRIVKQGNYLSGFIRRSARFLRWKFGFTNMEIYARSIGYVVKEGKILAYNKEDDFVLASKEIDVDEDLVLQQLQVFVEVLYNYDIVGKERVKTMLFGPDYVLAMLFKYIINPQDPDDLPQLVDHQCVHNNPSIGIMSKEGLD